MNFFFLFFLGSPGCENLSASQKGKKNLAFLWPPTTTTTIINDHHHRAGACSARNLRFLRPQVNWEWGRGIGWGGKKQVACWCGHGACLEAATADREVKSQ
jgi:hypothetical protein